MTDYGRNLMSSTQRKIVKGISKNFILNNQAWP